MTAVPADAQRTITTTRWTAIPAVQSIVPHQPASSIACSLVYRVSYRGPHSPIGFQGSVPTAVCGDARRETPFVRWIQDLGTQTPALFDGVAADAALMAALREALEAGAAKTAKTLVVNTFRALWGAKPSGLLGGAVGPMLEGVADGYVRSVVGQAQAISTAPATTSSTAGPGAPTCCAAGRGRTC